MTAIDDATGKLVKAVMGENESVEAVFNFWREYVEKIGIPVELYVDKLSTYKINHPKATDKIKYKDHYLNFFLLPERPKKIRSNPVILTTNKPNYIPPKDHPWRHFRYGYITS